MIIVPEHSSFRDRDGYIFYSEGIVFRAIAPSYRDTWEAIKNTRFFNELVNSRRVLPFTTSNMEIAGAATVIRPEPVPFITYPCEWTFHQLRAAALLTLELQEKAMAEGYSLKDASAYNVQFIGPDAVF